MVKITRNDFIQVDSQRVFAVGNFLASFAPDKDGNFKLTIHILVEPIPPATQNPTEPEWTVCEALVNKFYDAYELSERMQT